MLTKHLLLSFMALTFLAGCSQEPKLTLRIFECGEIEVRDISLFSPGVDEGVTKHLVDSCYLIQHEKGSLIWDTGITDAVGTKGLEKFGGKLSLKVTNPLMSQLEAINVAPESIQYLGISHFHADHTGNANAFSNAKLLIQKEEFEAAFGATPQKFGFNPQSYSKLDKDNAQILEGDHDVFGDGSVIIKRAPGHTPGHQMLLVNLAETGPVLLSGDLYHFTKNREQRGVPAFNFDKPMTLESMDLIEGFLKESGAQLWIQHDKEQNAELLHSPKFYF